MFGMFCVMYGRMIFSNVFAIGERSDMGLYAVEVFLSLFCLCIGMIFAVFHRCGMSFLFIAFMYMFVRYVIASGPRCFRCCMFMLSGPVELFVLLFLIAVIVCVSVMLNVLFWSLCMFLDVMRLVLSVV